MITFDRVSKRYPSGRTALDHVSFVINDGELVLLEGHSGAGKSTLLKLVATVERPSGGAVLINGQNVGSIRASSIPYLRRNIGMVFQDQKLLFDRNALENVLLPLSIIGVPRQEALRRARAALDKVGLLPLGRAMPLTLSGGEQQRLAIARAVVHNPKLLLADEPTANLDPDTAQQVADLLLDFHQAGVTVLIATYASGLFDHAPAHRSRSLRLQQGTLR